MHPQPTVLQARVLRAKSNSLLIDFHDGAEEPYARAAQGGADGGGKKLGVLFGFKNGGTGNHLVTYSDGSTQKVESKDGKPSVLSRGDVAMTVERGATSTVRRADGSSVLSVLPDGDDVRTPDLFRLLVQDGEGRPLGRLDIVRRASGWSLIELEWEVFKFFYFLNHAGQALKIPLIGAQAQLDRRPTDEERDALTGVITDILIGLRPYVAAMN